MISRLAPTIGLVLIASLVARATPPQDAERPRLIVLTDISSLVAGEAEPDDGQSLIRLMLYSNEFDIEGLVASSNLGHGQSVRPELIRRVVDAYGMARPNLLLHDDRYPPADDLRDVIKAGRPVAGPKVPVADSVGDGKDTEGSHWIIRVVDSPDPRPVWVVIWGGSADLAQALWKVRRERGPEELGRFLAKLRVHSIGDQDSTGPWIREQFPELLTIVQRRAYRGMYRGGDADLVSPAWVRENIHGHGPLGGLYPDYDGGDIWSTELGPVRGIKEGDSPSFLSLVPNGLFDPDHPRLGSWGGRFEGEGERLHDVADADLDTSGDPDPRMSSVYRWRPAFQADFAARLDWCVKPFAEANHPPTVRISGDRERDIKVGGELTIDAGGTTDPDGDEMDFAWDVYPAETGLAGMIRVEGRDTKRPRLVIPPAMAGKTVPVLISVTDRGRPRLTRYARVLVKVAAAE
ncbi:nucleoside hydrolase-like domain-containing protein [Paludisphaera sp.]|uniref:nucleoside hydrolase-like domain-containing protein n=1 Tax=Paludisphaera sp. TaxID=2017432 RepID=UPI00301CA59F